MSIIEKDSTMITIPAFNLLTEQVEMITVPVDWDKPKFDLSKFNEAERNQSWSDDDTTSDEDSEP